MTDRVLTRRTTRAALIGAACVLLGLLVLAPGAQARTREYWISAVRKPWNIVPNGHDALAHGNGGLDPATFRTEAIAYERWTRGFRERRRNNSAGVAGPLIRAETGDRIVIHFRNLDLDAPHSMHFHGVGYRPSSDGAYLPGFSGKDAKVEPGETYTYRLRARRDSVGVWPYHDHSPSMEESLEGGMYGVLSIRRRGEPLPDRENVVVFTPMGEYQTIDGRAFVGNTPVFHARVGDLVQWDVVALGSEHHTFHVHGHRWRRGGVPEDTRTVGPAESFRVRWRERASGTWLYHCHVEDHMAKGMIGLYRVKK